MWSLQSPMTTVLVAVNFLQSLILISGLLIVVRTTEVFFRLFNCMYLILLWMNVSDILIKYFWNLINYTTRLT